MHRRPSICSACLAGLLALASTAVRAKTFQFDASHVPSVTLGASNTVSQWRSRVGNALLAPLHGPSNGWTRAVAQNLASGRGRIDFAVAGVASPLHAPDATGIVFYAFAVVRCEAAADLATLLDAPCSARFDPVAWPGDPWTLSTAQLDAEAAYAVNGVATNTFAGASGHQLVEVFWSAPVALDALYFGGAAASPAWNRAWSGELAELILLAAHPTAAERDALWFYANRKWGVPVAATGSGVADTLRSLGVLPGPLFASIVIVR